MINFDITSFLLGFVVMAAIHALGWGITLWVIMKMINDADDEEKTVAELRADLRRAIEELEGKK